MAGTVRFSALRAAPGALRHARDGNHHAGDARCPTDRHPFLGHAKPPKSAAMARSESPSGPGPGPAQKKGRGWPFTCTRA
jgi:hypothetical protein